MNCRGVGRMVAAGSEEVTYSCLTSPRRGAAVARPECDLAGLAASSLPEVLVTAVRMQLRQNGAILESMPSVQVKDVPEDVHAVLRRRAAEAGQSLQEYLRARLVEEARRPTVEEILTRSGGRAGGRVTFESATKQLRRERDSR